MAPPIDAREKLGTALRQALTQTPLSKISVSALTRAAGVTRQAFYYHFNSLNDLNAWVFREEVTARLTTSSGEWLDAIEATMTWMHRIQELIESRLPGSASATARDVVAQHFALATTAHMAQWMLSGLEVNPSLAIARMRVLMSDQTTPALGRLAK